MRVWIRRGLLLLTGLVLLLAALAAWFVSSFDANRYKGVAIDWMKTHRHRTLVIDGPIELSLFPRLAVKLSKVSLSEVERADVFAALDEAGLAVDVLPLLRGELVVGRVDAKGVRLSYLRDARGKSNIDDLLQPSSSTPSETSASKPARFDVSGIRLTDVQARVKDEVSGVDGQLLVKSFSSGRLANKTEAPVELAARFDFKQPAVKGDLTGNTRLTLDTDTASAALRDMNLSFKGDAPGASAVDAAFKGSLAWDGAKKSVDAQSLSVQVSGQAAGLKLEGTTLALDRFAFDPARKAMTLRKLQVRVKGNQGGQALNLEMDWPELSVDGERLAGGPFSGKFSRGGEMPVTASFKSGAPSGGFDAVRLPGFEAQVSSDAPQRKLNGTLRSDLTLKPNQRSLAFDKLALQAKIEEPQSPALTLGVQGSAVASAQRSSWNLSGQLNDNRFTTDGNATLSGKVPQVVAKARFDSLDLNKVMSPAAAAKKPEAPATAADTPVDLAPLRILNGQFSLHAARFAFRQYRVDDARIEATLDNGLLRISQLQGKAWGGTLDSNASADARSNRIAVKAMASGVNVNALIKDVAAKDLIEGTGRVTMDVDTTGRSVNELKSRLHGSAALLLRDGAIKGINLAKSLRQAKAALSMRQDSAQKASQAEKTDFSELSASFQIADGIARSRDLDLKSPFLRLGGEGAIDVGRGRIDYVTRATVTTTSQGQDGADLAALKGLTIPVRLSGPFEAVDWKIEWSAVAKDAVTNQLKDKLGEKLGLKPAAGAASSTSPQDALRNKLKGLFK